MKHVTVNKAVDTAVFAANAVPTAPVAAWQASVAACVAASFVAGIALFVAAACRAALEGTAAQVLPLRPLSRLALAGS